MRARAGAVAATLVPLLALPPFTHPLSARIYDTVSVRGAEFIDEALIRETCGTFAGVDYSDYELRAIEECLMLTGVFESTRLVPEGDTLVIEVTEIDTRPGRIEGALAYVSDDGLVAELAFERYNLWPDTYGAANLSFNDEVREVGANFYRRDAFGETLDFGLDLLVRETDYDDRSFSEHGWRVEPYLAWTPTEDLRVETALGWRDYRMFDVDPTASALLRRETHDAISAPYLRLSVDVTRPLPGFGARPDDDWAQAAYALRLDQHIWNIGTGDALLDTRLEATGQVPLGADHRLIGRIGTGHVAGLDGNEPRAIDRYFPAAESLRGFAPRGTGPRDRGDALGGNRYITASLEAQRALGEVLEMPMRAGIFVDAGAAWELDDTLGGQIDDGWHTRSSIGLSLTFEVAQTPVSLYVAKPMSKERGDETQALGISFSARF